MTTRVTLPNGKVFIEKKGERVDGNIQEQSCGFVVDTKPDLQVGELGNGLLVASQDVANDAALLEQLGVTHVLNVSGFSSNKFPGFHYLDVTVLDTPEELLNQHFPNCFIFIEEGLKKGCVLVHCNAGISRSVSIVTAYLMTRNKWTFDHAMQVVRAARPSAKPNEGFVRQLQAYERCIVNRKLDNNLP